MIRVPQVAAKLAPMQFVALSTDMWSSDAKQAYIAVTCHGIDSTWAMRRLCLDVEYFPESHTATNIRTRLEQLIIEYKLDDKLCAVVRDGGSNIVAAVERILADRLSRGKPEILSASCIAHQINLATRAVFDVKKNKNGERKSVGNSFKPVVVLLDKLQEIAVRLSRSHHACERLRKLANAKYEQLPRRSMTRWFADYLLLASALRMRSFLTEMSSIAGNELTDDPSLTRLEMPTPSEWILAEELASFLKFVPHASTVVLPVLCIWCQAFVFHDVHLLI